MEASAKSPKTKRQIENEPEDNNEESSLKTTSVSSLDELAKLLADENATKGARKTFLMVDSLDSLNSSPRSAISNLASSSPSSSPSSIRKDIETGSPGSIVATIKAKKQTMTEEEAHLKSLKDEEEAQRKNKTEIHTQSKQHYDSLKNKEWFFGDIDRDAAEAILYQCNEDSFLVRNSYLSDNFAISLFSFKDHIIHHALVKPLDYGQRYYQLQDSARMYPTLEELILKSAEFQGYKSVQRPKNMAVSRASIIVTDITSSLDSKEETLQASNNGIEKSPTKEIVEVNVDIDALTKEVKQAADSTNSNQTIAKLKGKLQMVIDSQEKLIQEYDRKLATESLNTQEQVKLSDEDNDSYLTHMQNIAKVKELLQQLRLRGDEFRILYKKENKLFKINSEGQIMFCNVVRTKNVNELAPPSNMSNYAYFNVAAVEGVLGGTIYEITSAKAIHYIDEVEKIIPDTLNNKIRRGGCIIVWKNDKRSSFTTSIPDESTELIEVVGAHLKKFKQSAIKQIQLLKDIWKCKSTQYDPEVAEHTALLRRLWKTLLVDKPFQGYVDEEWKVLGFQGTKPATDFRGMGLLGLLNLIYFAEHYTERARKMVSEKREYPFAVTGINITSTLLSLLNLTKDLVNQPAPDKSWHNPLLYLFYYADHEDTFDELYCQAFLLFDRLWMHSRARYMDFPLVIKRVKQLIEDLLKRKPLDIKQLITWIEQLQISYTEYSSA